MDTVDRIFSLMDKHNVNAATLTREAKLTNGLVTQWKKRLQNPSAKNILKIASFFDVNPNYLLCHIDDPTPIINTLITAAPVAEQPIDPEAVSLIEEVQDLDKEEAAKVREYVQLLKMRRMQLTQEPPPE